MSITLRLDTQGLRAMIEDNPSFKLDIQQAVVNNIKNDHIEAAVRDRVALVLKGMATASGSYYSPKYTITDKGFLEAIAAASKVAVDASIDEAIKSRISAHVAQAVETEREVLRRELKSLLKELVTPEMAREIMREKILQ